MSEYCDTCEEVLDWISDDMPDRDNCVKCQIKAAKAPLEEEIRKLRQAIMDILDHDGGNRLNYEEITQVGKEALGTLTATERGFKVGKVYHLPYDKRCTYHIVSETHYTAVFADGSLIPAVHDIGELGELADGYEEVKA